MVWIGTMVLLLALQVEGLTNAPEGSTLAEKLLIWFCGILLAGNVAQFWLNQRIHKGHKDQIREQEKAFADACRELQRDERSHREQISGNLIDLIGTVATSEKDLAVAMKGLADKIS